MIKPTKKSLIAITIILLIIFCLNSILVYATDTWPMFGHDPQRTGYSTSTTLNTNETKWVSYDLGSSSYAGIQQASPIIADGLVIVKSFYGITAGNITNGKQLWSYLGGGYRLSPIIDSGRIYASLGNLVCLNKTTGTLLWEFAATNPDSSEPHLLVDNGKVFVIAWKRVGTSISYPLYCLNATDGSIIWQTSGFSNYGYGNGNQIISNNILYVTTQGGLAGGTLYAINASNGFQIWNCSGAGSLPTYKDGKIFIKLNSNITCLNAITGTLTWKTPLDAEVLAIANNRLLASGQDKLYCLDATTGSRIWTFTDRVISSVAIADGKAYFTIGDPKPQNYRNTTFTCVDLTTGKPIWYYNVPDNEFSNPAISNGVVYVGASGRLYAFGKNDTITVPMSLGLSLDSDTSLIGFRVNLKGKLQGNVTSFVNQKRALSFSINDGESWNDITMVPTSSDGSYSAIWQPSATGTYLVKAYCSFTPDYPYNDPTEIETVRMLSVNSFDNQNVFSVASNSTVSALAFNSSSKELSFTVSGDNGTKGFVDLSIAKNLVTNIFDVKVYLDNVNLNYTATSTSTSWLLHFTYNHSTHNVNINLASQVPVIPEFSSSLILSLFMIVTLLISLIYFRKHKH